MSETRKKKKRFKGERKKREWERRGKGGRNQETNIREEREKEKLQKGEAKKRGIRKQEKIEEEKE